MNTILRLITVEATTNCGRTVEEDYPEKIRLDIDTVPRGSFLSKVTAPISHHHTTHQG